MAGVLQFTLGLETSKFLEQVGISSGKLLSLAGAGEMVKKAMENVWRQIERGAALEDLSKRTGESVQNLFMLQKGFKAVGLSADSVGGAIFMLNKSLGGVNEMGEDTASVFQKVGLSVSDLKKAGGAGAIQSVLEKMSGMNQTSATAFAGKIFGRGEAANMVQASRSMKEFSEAMAGARAQAAVFQRVAAVFDSIEKTLVKVKAKLDPIWLVLAEKVAPVLKKVLDWINNIDLSPLGNALGDTWDVFAEAFAEGKVLDLIMAGFDAAAEYLGNMIIGVLGDGGFWRGIWSVMVGEFKVQFAEVAKIVLSLGTLISAAMAAGWDKTFEVVGKIPGVGKALGLEGHKGWSTKEFYADMQKKNEGKQGWLNDVFASGMGDLGTGMGGVAESMARAQAGSGGSAQDAFSEMVGGLLGARRGKAGKPGTGRGPGGDEQFNLTGKGGERPAASELEKMGFVLGGAGSGPMATTAKNTTRMVAQLDRLVGAMTGRAGGMEELNGLPV